MRKLHYIQALRGFAASLVVVSHALTAFVKNGLIPKELEESLWSIGSFGVSTFFIISGFIMIRTSYEDFGSVKKAGLFAFKRTIRIVPIYWVATFLYFVSHWSKFSWVDLVYSLFFIPHFTLSTGVMHPVLGQGWSLNYEMFFYALFALSLLLPRKKALVALFLSFFAIVGLGSFVKPLSDGTAPLTAIEFLASPLILLFACGMALGVWERKAKPKYQFSYPALVVFLSAAGVVSISLALELPHVKPLGVRVLLWIPAVLSVLACVLAERTKTDRFEKVAERLGDASYSTYLFHGFLLGGIQKIVDISTIEIGIAFVIVSVVGSNLLGLFINSSFEKPVTEWLKALFLKKKKTR